MDRWLTTGQAAEILGTSSTTVRALAVAGALQATVTPRAQRRRWLISQDSTYAYLEQHGRIDERRRGRRPAGGDGDGTGLVSAAAERDRLRAENVALREAALRLRARNDAVAAAQAHQARAAQLLINALAEQTAATAQLEQALAAQDDALGQFLIPGTTAGGR